MPTTLLSFKQPDGDMSLVRKKVRPYKFSDEEQQSIYRRLHETFELQETSNTKEAPGTRLAQKAGSTLSSNQKRKLKQIVTCLYKFSRASRQLHVFTLNFPSTVSLDCLHPL